MWPFARYVVFAATAVILPFTSLSGQDQAAPDKVVRVTAERFAFTPSAIEVVEGSRVELRISSDDTTHGFRLIGPGDIDLEIPRRGRGDVRVVLPAMPVGKYVFECSRLCGAGHGFMRGTLIVRAGAGKP